jgi:hypothetical protein
MAANGKTPVERWTDRCLHRLGDEGLVFSGNAQNDWRGFESVICDEAELTGFDTVTKLADGVAGRSVAVPVTMQEFKMFLTGLKIIFPTNSSMGDDCEDADGSAGGHHRCERLWKP